MKIIQINGFRGMLMAGFIIACLFCGFVASPGIFAMRLWNHFLTPYGLPVLDAFQGVLLWLIVALTYYVLSSGHMPVSFASPDKITDAELDMIMKKAKMHSDLRKMNAKIMTMDKFEKEIQNTKKYKDDEESCEDNIANIK